MAKWISFNYEDDVGLFGIMDIDLIIEHEGDFF